MSRLIFLSISYRRARAVELSAENSHVAARLKIAITLGMAGFPAALLHKRRFVFETN